MLFVIMMNSLSATETSLITDQYGQNVLDFTEKMPHEQMPDWGYTLTAAVLFSIGFFGFSLNLFVIVLMCKDIQVSSHPFSVLLRIQQISEKNSVESRRNTNKILFRFYFKIERKKINKRNYGKILNDKMMMIKFYLSIFSIFLTTLQNSKSDFFKPNSFMTFLSP